MDEALQAARARGDDLKARMLAELNWVDVPGVAEMLGCTVSKVEEYLENGDLLGIEHDDRTLIPAVLMSDGEIVPRLGEVVRGMELESPWIRLMWLVGSCERLGGRRLLSEAIQLIRSCV
jgi:hypothetical protein